MPLQISGLNEKQKRILDIMWNLPTKEDLERWRNNLPKHEFQLSITLEELLKVEYIDSYVNTENDIQIAKIILEKINRKK